MPGNIQRYNRIETLDANPNAQDFDGQSALHYAALCEYKEIYDYLMRKGANDDLKDKSEETPKQWIPSEWK